MSIALQLAVPVGILRKGAVESQVHGYGLAVGHVGDEVGGLFMGDHIVFAVGENVGEVSVGPVEQLAHDRHEAMSSPR